MIGAEVTELSQGYTIAKTLETTETSVLFDHTRPKTSLSSSSRSRRLKTRSRQ
jgi:hypothetical protein